MIQTSKQCSPNGTTKETKWRMFDASQFSWETGRLASGDCSFSWAAAASLALPDRENLRSASSNRPPGKALGGPLSYQTKAICSTLTHLSDFSRPFSGPTLLWVTQAQNVKVVFDTNTGQNFICLISGNHLRTLFLFYNLRFSVKIPNRLICLTLPLSHLTPMLHSPHWLSLSSAVSLGEVCKLPAQHHHTVKMYQPNPYAVKHSGNGIWLSQTSHVVLTCTEPVNH